MPHDAAKTNFANITDAELAVLDALWSEGSATIRRIADLVYPSGTSAHYATVQKLFERLEAKGCVARNRSGFAHVFTAAVDREDVIAQRLRAVAEQLCEGSMTPLLLQLVHGARLSADERAALKKLIDESDNAPASRTSANRKGRRDA
ncbi:MAG: BlaI/MecI/CopY family transcriptional regulator [Pirellulales bacterium]